MKLPGLITVALLSIVSNIVYAQTAPSWGAASSFAVLASSTVTNTGGTVITGNVGVSPGTAITGFPPALITNGATYSAVASLAGPAQVAAVAVFSNITGQIAPPANNLTGIVLGSAGNTTLEPGVYSFSSSAQITGTITLNDHGNPNAVFIFKIGSTLTTATSAVVRMSSGGQGPNVFWQIGSSATIGTYTTFLGNIIATASITMTTGATTTGRLFALNAAVTMDNNRAFAIAAVVADADGDGVPDLLDDYPNDATKAYNNYSSAGAGSTVAFEDQWPFTGDFDMNDLVMAYKYNVITNAQNTVVQVVGNFTLQATGGTFGNGFGVEFPLLAGNISSVTGGTQEAGQTKAVIVLFTNTQTEMATWNTQPGVTQTTPKTYTVTFNVANGPTLTTFGFDYNPFIFNLVASSRREVHLVGKTPTTLADQTIFGSANDNTNVALGRYYVTKTGLPYAISLPVVPFSYPVESADITQAYTHFAAWAQSGGTLFLDWYSNTAVGYRNSSLIYTN